MARKKGGQLLMEMARKGRQRKVADSKPMVAGDPKFRLGPVGPEEPYEAFNWDAAPESPGLFRKLLSKLTESRDYSQPVEPRQEALEKELGEAKRLLEKLEKVLSKQSTEAEPLPSELPGHKEEVAKRVKDRLVEEEAKRKKIRELIHLDNLPEIKALLAKPRKKEKKKRAAETIEAVAAEPAENAFTELEAETMKRFPYPKDDQQMLEIYERIARAFEQEIGAPADYIRNEAIHTLIHSRVDPAFNKFYDSIGLVDESGDVETFTGEIE